MRRLRIIGTLGEIYTLDNQPITSELWSDLIRRTENTNKQITLDLQETYYKDSESEIEWETIAQFKTQN